MTSISTKDVHWISSAAQVDLLASPVRQEIVDTLAATGPRTIRELAAMLGVPADGLYYHLRRLMEAELVVQIGTTPTARRDAAVYDVPATEVRLDYSVPEVRARAVGVVAAAFRAAGRDFAEAVPSDGAVTRGPGRNLLGGRKKGWLSASELERFNALLDEAFDLLDASRPGDGRQLYSFTAALSPKLPMPGRR